MPSKISRRDLFKLLGGTAVGLAFTPIPWKVLDDVAIWTQNWSWVPRPLRGAISAKYTTCTLCGAACGVRARCVAARPVSLSGVPHHPVSHGALCPAGLGGHHLHYHPSRAPHPLKLVRRGDLVDTRQVSVDDVVAGLAGTLTDLTSTGLNGSLAILDERPGRTISNLYRRFLTEFKGGVYVTPPHVEGSLLTSLGEMFETPYGPLGFDFENAKTILSFGAPLFDGWGTPGRMMSILNDRARSGLKLVQIETQQSRTAMLADRWVPVRPGTEAAFALGIGHVIVKEGLYDRKTARVAADFEGGSGATYRALVEKFTPEYVSGLTGVTAGTVIDVAREAAAGGAMAVPGNNPAGGPLGHDDELAIWGLNFLLGSVGRTGGIVPRNEIPAGNEKDGSTAIRATALSRVPDHSIRVLIIDPAQSGNALPWSCIEQKLAPGRSVVVSLSPFLVDSAKHADYVVPSPAYLESLQDAPGPFDAKAASFAISTPLAAPASGATEPVEFLGKLAASAGITLPTGFAGPTLEAALRKRVEAIKDSGRGRAFSCANGSSTEVSAVPTADNLYKLLVDGGVWVDAESAPRPVPRFSFFASSTQNYHRLLSSAENPGPSGSAQEYPLLLVPTGMRGAAGGVSPLLTKVYQESRLRDDSHHASMNPATGREYGIADRAQVWIETPNGSMTVQVHLDPLLMPGIILAGVGPDPASFDASQTTIDRNILSLCTVEPDSTWRVTRAKVRGV